MIGLYVTVPIACFRKGQAREFFETEVLPPPSTCYGFLLSLVGETDRKQHIGCRVTAGTFSRTMPSVVLRTVWRVKNKPLGSSGNTRPDYQQLLTDVRLLIWLDSAEEKEQDNRLEDRVVLAMKHPEKIARFGGLALGESTHMVNDVCIFDPDQHEVKTNDQFQLFIKKERGRLTLPVWVDHVGSAGTIFVTGDLADSGVKPPDVDRLPKIVDTAL